MLNINFSFINNMIRYYRYRSTNFKSLFCNKTGRIISPLIYTESVFRIRRQNIGISITEICRSIF